MDISGCRIIEVGLVYRAGQALRTSRGCAGNVNCIDAHKRLVYTLERTKGSALPPMVAFEKNGYADGLLFPGSLRSACLSATDNDNIVSTDAI